MARRKKGAKRGTAKRGTAKRGTKRAKKGSASALTKFKREVNARFERVEARVGRAEGYALAGVNAIRRHNGLKPLSNTSTPPSKALPKGRRTVAG